MRILMLALLLAWPGLARADRPGDFSYYVLALSWSPGWCAREGDARGAEQCTRDLGWSLHGLWPQREVGWPDFCQTANAPPSRAMTAGMADIMGSGGLAWHQWKKHGTCSGLTAQDYFRLSRVAYDRVNRPELLRKLTQELRIAPAVIEQAFLEANPAMTRDQITITCRDGHIAEARICLTRDLELRDCGVDVRRDCAADTARFEPIR